MAVFSLVASAWKSTKITFALGRMDSTSRSTSANACPGARCVGRIASRRAGGPGTIARVGCCGSKAQLPMAIWIAKGTIEGIPRELDEAATLDGAGHFGVLWHVILPLSGPALGAAGTLAFVGAWNEFVAGSVMVDAAWLKPVQPVIYSFIGFFGREWGPLTAAATLAIVPILVAFGFLGRYIVSGLTKGSVKG